MGFADQYQLSVRPANRQTRACFLAGLSGGLGRKLLGQR